MIKLNIRHFGGRGQSSPNVSKSPLDAVLGPRGKAKTVDEATKATNPNFTWSNSDYYANCTKCVWAWELNRRGYDVEALPLSADPSTQYGLSTTYVQHTNNIYQAGWTETHPNGRASRNKEIELYENYMLSHGGEGSRWIVRWGKRSGSGHVLNAEIKDGKIYMFDGQHDGRLPSGYSTTFKQYMKDHKSISVGNQWVLRIDNVTVDENEITKYVKRK